jgi:hypothetical protein
MVFGVDAVHPAHSAHQIRILWIIKQEHFSVYQQIFNIHYFISGQYQEFILLHQNLSIWKELNAVGDFTRSYCSEIKIFENKKDPFLDIKGTKNEETWQQADLTITVQKTKLSFNIWKHIVAIKNRTINYPIE